MSCAAPSRWVLASSNRGKLREIRQLLAPLDFTLISQDEVGVLQPPEDGQTFIENALGKARAAAAQSGLAAIADDSGLAVAALRGRPGIHSARFAGAQASDAENVARLLEELGDTPSGQRDACFHCVLVALTHAKDPAPTVVQGQWHGRIATAPRGAGGFGYDPVFIGAGLKITAAELTPEAKNQVSHRGKALAALVQAFMATPGP